MAEQETTTPETATAEGTTQTEPQTQTGQASTTAETDWKAKSREWEKRAKANADAATRLAQLEDQQKTEQQRLTERAEKAEREAQSREVSLTRYRVAVAKGVPAELVDRLRGDTEDEIAADADALLALVATPGTTTPRPDPSQGVRSGATAALNGDPLEASLRAKLGIT